MGRPSKYDWDNIEKYYKAGYPQKEIIDKFGCPKSSLSERIKKYNWEVNELSEPITKGIIEINEQKANLTELDSEIIPLIEDRANEISRRRGLIYNAVELSIKAKAEMLEKKKKTTLSKVEHFDDNGKKIMTTMEEKEVALSPNDFKVIDEGLDRNAITLDIAPRHSNQNINVNTQNNVAVQEITRKIV